MNTTPHRILVVDDDERVRAMLLALLEERGYAVETALGGAAAIERLAQTDAPRLDLVVLDLVMPEVDGWGVLERVRNRVPSVPVLLLSPKSSDPANGPFQECIAGHLYKPFRPLELIATCRRLLASSNAPEGAERRREARRRLVVDVFLLTQDGAPTVVGRLVDVSSRGLQMELDLPLDPGESVVVALHIPGPQAVLTLQGRLLWRNPAGPGFAYGVDIAGIPPDKERILRSVLDRRGP